MTQNINGILNLNVWHSDPGGGGGALSPDTGAGLGEIINNLGPAGCSIVVIAILTLIAGIILFCLRQKIANHKTALLSSLGLFAFAFGLSIPAIAMTSHAIDVSTSTNADIVTNLNITTAEGKDTVGTADANITLGDAPHGYTVKAYVDGDNALYNKDKSASVPATKMTATADPNTLSQNSYGIKDVKNNRWIPISTDASQPTIVYSTDEDSTGASFTLTYAAKINNSIPEGNYTNDKAIKYTVEPHHNFTLKYLPNTTATVGDLPATETFGPVADLKHNFTVSNTIPSRLGNVFTDWCEGDATETACNGTIYHPGRNITVSAEGLPTVDAETSLKAIWKEVILKFDANGGTGAPDAIPIPAGGVTPYTFTIPITPVPTRDGYPFLGWSTTTTGGEILQPGATIPISETTTLFARWDEREPVKPKVTYYKNTDDPTATVPGPTEADQPSRFPQDLQIDLNEPTRTGWTFLHYTTNPDGSGTVYEPGNTITTRDNVDLYAQWRINEYTITFDTAGGSEIAPITQNYGTRIAAPADPTREGYTFAGWNPAIPDTMPAENMTVTATWNPIQYTIVFDTDGGSPIDSITLDYGATIPSVDPPEKRFAEFTGWNPAIPAKMPLGGITVKATWSASEACHDSATSIYGANCMQDMNAAVKSSMTTGTQYKFKDSRDSTYYYAAKLKDGNVWMTQNLDLNLSTSVTLTNANTDLNGSTTSWKPSAGTVNAIGSWTNSNSAPRSFDPKAVYYYTSGSNSADTKYSSLAACKAAHSEEECAHYHAGNYYNWAAAIATNNAATLTTKAKEKTPQPNSICPKGWKLPQVTNFTYTSPDVALSDFGVMFNAQGITNGQKSKDYKTTDTSFINLRKDPIYWVRAGYINQDGTPGLGTTPGVRGDYWTGTVGDADDGTTAYVDYAFVNSAQANPAGRNFVGFGRSIRCIAR